MSNLSKLSAVKQAIMAAKLYFTTQLSELAGTVQSLFEDIGNDLDAHTSNTTVHVTSEEKSAWDAKLSAESDPTVPAWAKAANKPTYTASEVGAQPTITANGILKGDGAGGVTAAAQGTDYPAPSVSYAATLTASGWVDGVQTVTITGLAADADGTVGYADGLTDEQLSAMLGACIVKTAQAENSVTFRAMGTVPTVDIPIVAVVVG